MVVLLLKRAFILRVFKKIMTRFSELEKSKAARAALHDLTGKPCLGWARRPSGTEVLRARD